MSIVAAVKKAVEFNSDEWKLYLSGEARSSHFRNEVYPTYSAWIDSDLMRMATALPDLRRTLQKGNGLYL